ncbi:MAG TPA: helicase-related protein, partial [Leptolyngbyaceae cyanobacterium]
SARSQAGRRAMLAHRQAKEIALGTDGKLRILADLLAQHYPERSLIFTNDNATVYRISQAFLIPAITHQTPVKERHDILTHFREGEYKTLVASHVLNEGVDVPDARVAIILSGTGSEREYIQRLGRVLRKGTDNNKLALLYEVVAEDTTEEGTSQRRRGSQSRNEPQRREESKEVEKPKLKHRQLEILPSQPYEVNHSTTPKAAESSAQWGEDDTPDIW